MGSPQPPLVMPQSTTSATAVTASRFSKLPLDVKVVIFQHIDSFSTLSNLMTALGWESRWTFELFRRGISSAVARNEFAPVADALMAVKMMSNSDELRNAIATSRNETSDRQIAPRLVKLLTSTIDTGPGMVDAAGTLRGLQCLNEVTLGLARYYEAIKELEFSTTEHFRFKRALFRCVTFFELYKESRASKYISTSASSQSDDEDEEEGESESEEPVDPQSPRVAFLGTLSHQEVLEMDCVREYLWGFAEAIAMGVNNGDKDEGGMRREAPVSRQQVKCTLEMWGLFGYDTGYRTCACFSSVGNDMNEANDRNDDTNGDNSYAPCHNMNTERLTESILLLGPVAIYRLYDVLIEEPRPNRFLRALVHTLVPFPRRNLDIFQHEIVPFWSGLSKEYDVQEGDTEEIIKAKAAKMPKGCYSIMDVMAVVKYEYAILDNGRLFN